VKKVPQRTCIGCLTRRSKEEFIRLVAKKNQVTVDSLGKARGRGAYLCRTRRKIKKGCLKRATERGGFKRAFSKTVDINKLLKNYGQEKDKRNQKRETSNSTSGGGDLGPC
jgi:predicted RNA-binding protein YlxR (DUF448 family)